MEILKVSSKSNANSVAGAVKISLEKDPAVKLLAIGAGAVNQAVKAVAIASGYLAPKGIDFNTKICFKSVQIDDREKTAIEFTLTNSGQ